MNGPLTVLFLFILYLLVMAWSQERPARHGLPLEILPALPDAWADPAFAGVIDRLLILQFDSPVCLQAREAPDHPFALLVQRNLACYAWLAADGDGNPSLRLLAFLADGSILLAGPQLPLPSLNDCPWIRSSTVTDSELEAAVSAFARELREEAAAGRTPLHASQAAFAQELGRRVDAWDAVKIARLHEAGGQS